MKQKNLFSDYQKEMMAEYLDSQFNLYLKLWERAYQLYSRLPLHSKRECTAERLMYSFHGKMDYISKLRWSEFM